MSTLKVLHVDGSGVTYADPADRGNTVRFKSSTSKKALNGIPVSNHVTEIIYNDDFAAEVAGVSVQDALSVRLRTSGTAASSARLREILLSMAAQVGQWESEGVFTGFPPVTAPVIEAVVTKA